MKIVNNEIDARTLTPALAEVYGRTYAAAMTSTRYDYCPETKAREAVRDFMRLMGEIVK